LGPETLLLMEAEVSKRTTRRPVGRPRCNGPALRVKVIIRQESYPLLFELLSAVPLRQRAKWVRQALSQGGLATLQAMQAHQEARTAAQEALIRERLLNGGIFGGFDEEEEDG